MLVIGSILAVISGTLNAAAAALQKHEGMQTAPTRMGLALLAALARRPIWLAAMGLSALGWVFEGAALALAPTPVVATLRNAGRGLLVMAGSRWLNERFTRTELVGVALASGGGVFTALGAASSPVRHKPLSNLTEVEIAATCIIAAAIVAFFAARLAAGRKHQPLTTTSPYANPHPSSDRRTKAAGLLAGAARGLLFAGTGVFTKEVGDRFALHGLAGLAAVLATPGPWLMTAMTIWAQSLIQDAFRRANAASVSAANASVSSLGLIAAGFVLYGEGVPKGSDAVFLFGGIVVALAGTALLLASRPALVVLASGADPPDDRTGTDKDGPPAGTAVPLDGT